MTIIEAAAFLAQQWPVFPCAGNKQPLTEHGLHDAVEGEAQARALFQRPGVAMIGVPTGARSGFVVIDLDIKGGQPGLEWLAANEHRIPATRRHRTQSGGLHLLFANPEGRRIRNSVSKVAPGVDVRGQGGYVIVPPSPGYTIVNDAMPAPMPAWLLDLLDPPAPAPAAPAPRPRIQTGDGTPYGLRALEAETSAILAAPFGQQETTLNAACLRLGQLVAGGELAADVAFPALLSAALGMASQPGREPWVPAKLREKVRAAFADGQRTPRSAPPLIRRTVEEYAPPPGWEEPPPRDEAPPHWQADPDAAPDMPPAAERSTADGFPLHDVLLDDEAAIPERRWVGGPGAFPRPRISAIAGPPGVSKTTFALEIAISLAAGLSFAGIVADSEPRRVLMAVIEDEIDEVRRRAHAAVAALADHPSLRRLIIQNLRIIDIADAVPLFVVTPDGRITETPGFARLEATCAEFRPDLLILDPLLELHTAEESSNTLMRPVMKRLRGLASNFDLALAIIHHEAKSGEGNALQRLRGAGGIGGAIRNLMSLRPMTADEAKEAGVAEDMADLYIRVETGKQQYARKARPRWLIVEERELANGDRAHLLMPWNAPRTDITAEMEAAAVAALRRGIKGEPCSESPRAGAFFRNAWDASDIPRGCHSELLRRLMTTGEVAPRAWRDPIDRKVRKRLWVESNGLEGWVEDDRS